MKLSSLSPEQKLAMMMSHAAENPDRMFPLLSPNNCLVAQHLCCLTGVSMEDIRVELGTVFVRGKPKYVIPCLMVLFVGGEMARVQRLNNCRWPTGELAEISGEDLAGAILTMMEA